MAKDKKPPSRTMLSPEVEERFAELEARIAALEPTVEPTQAEKDAAEKRAAAQKLLDEANALSPQ